MNSSRNYTREKIYSPASGNSNNCSVSSYNGSGVVGNYSIMGEEEWI